MLISVGREMTHTALHMWTSEDNLQRLALSLHYMGSRDWTQFISLSIKHLYLLKQQSLFYLDFLKMYVSLHGFDVHCTCMQELKEARRGYQIPWGQTTGSLKLPRGCRGPGPESSARVASALNHEHHSSQQQTFQISQESFPQKGKTEN